MRTNEMITTVTWNSEEFLIQVLEDLEREGIIEYYLYMYHISEDDEYEKKDHIHLMVKPNRVVDTVVFRSYFFEEDPENDKPIKPLPFEKLRKSNFSDFFLYTLHDKSYLAYKGQARKFHYSVKQYVCSSEELLNEFNRRAHTEGDFALHCRRMELINNEDLKPSDLILQGYMPLQMANNINALMNLKTTYRNGRMGHGDAAED